MEDTSRGMTSPNSATKSHTGDRVRDKESDGEWTNRRQGFRDMMGAWARWQRWRRAREFRIQPGGDV